MCSAVLPLPSVKRLARLRGADPDAPLADNPDALAPAPSAG